jgi:hypothetical protein
MMELFLSKVWAFVVSLFLMSLLLQGVQMQVDEERDLALQGTAEELEDLFLSLERAGEGMERTIDLHLFLPAEATLLLGRGYGTLQESEERICFRNGIVRILAEENNGTEEVQELILFPGNMIKVVVGETGMTVVALSPRSSPPGT